MSGNQTELIPVPGTGEPLVLERTPDGRLLRVAGGGRVYFEADEPGRARLGELAEIETLFLPSGMIRRVAAGGRRWNERYGWDSLGHLTHVDGVDMRYDGEGRILSCRGRGGAWDYGYAGAHLAVIGTPAGLRHIFRADDGRPVSWRQDGRSVALAYDGEGRRTPAPRPPASWRFDGLGRLIAMVDEAGLPLRTYLWDGWHCLGVLGGGPGAPLVEAYSLDPTGTPVRRIGAAGVDIWPRDAFGESLLAAAGAPGLFGGAIAGGFVHLPLRRLDPLIASFDSPDPNDGEASDPRRGSGWTGPLPVELPAAGPYTVCRNNPVTLADPTGGISDLWWLIPSALTWSIQNTIGSLLGLWLNLQFSPLGWIVSAAAGHRPFDAEWVSAKNFDAFALRADGWLASDDHAFTYQFLMSADRDQITNLDDARLFAPTADFLPPLYGSVLRCSPENGTPFLVQGQREVPNGAPMLNWSRCGGTGVAAFPGSRVPIFPGGGMHFDVVQRGIKPGPATMTELAPSDTVLAATIGQFAAVSVPGTGLGLAIGTDFTLTDPAGLLVMGRVEAAHEEGGATILRTDTPLTGLAAGPLRFEGVTAALPTEPLTPVAGRNTLLDAAGSSNDYAPSVSVVRLSRGGPPLGAAAVTALEARVTLDAAFPAGLGSRTPVRLATASGAFTAKTGTLPAELEITSGTVPAIGDGMVVNANFPAIVTNVVGAVVTLDRPALGLGPAGTSVNWANLAPGAEVGALGAAADAAAQLTYVPTSLGLAPTGGFLWLQQGLVKAARQVTGRAYDGILLGAPLPDANAAPFTVERFRHAAPDIAGATATTEATFALTAAPPADATALQIVGFAAAAPVTGATLTTGTLAAGVLSTTIPWTTGTAPTGLRPGEAVALVPGGGGATTPAQIRRITLDVTLDRTLPVTAAVEIASLTPDALTYDAVRVDARVLRVRPVPGGGGAGRLDFPRLRENELVLVTWTDSGGAQQRLYRVLSFAGGTITCDTDAPDVPAGTTGITVQRLIANDPRTGSARRGRSGTIANGATNAVLTVDAWRAQDFAPNRYVAVILPDRAFAAQVLNVDQALRITLAGAGTLSGAFDLLALTGIAEFVTGFTSDGAVLSLTAPPITLAAAQSAVVIPWIDSAVTAAGEVHPGSVRVPEDHENTSLQNTRREAVIDHELVHTLQSAKWGPLLLGVMPLWAIELGADLSSAGGPEFTPYGAGTLGDGKLTATDATLLAPDGHVQVAQSRRSVAVSLAGAADGGGVLISDSSKAELRLNRIVDGPVQIRKELGTGGASFLEWMTNIGQVLTIGGALNNASLLGWGGVAALITTTISAIRTAVRSRTTASLAADRTTLTLDAAHPLEGLRAGILLAVKNGDNLVIRSVATATEQTATLDAATPQWASAGAPAPLDVELSIYSPGARLFGLRDYFMASMPDPNQPARLQFAPVGGQPSFAANDRIEIRMSSGTTHRTVITRVDGQAIEVNKPPLLRNDQPNEFLIGKIAAQDATGWVDDWLLNEAGVGWMQYAHDPWGHIIARNMPDRSNTAGQVFARSARYLFGTTSWSMLPFFGYFFYDNAFRRGKAYLSQMEQQASVKSGDTYSPLGSLHGEVTVIGDVARYWVTVLGGTRDFDRPSQGDWIMTTAQDAPGVALIQGFQLQTNPAGSPPATPSGLPAPRVPRTLYNVDANELFTGVDARGWVPAGPHLERSAAMHVVFTQPPAAPNHHTIISNMRDFADSIEADDKDKASFYFDRTPADVAVTAAAVAVAENSTFSMIPFQRADFAVSPNGPRIYRLTIGGPGALFDADRLRLTARGTLGTDEAEISRFHEFNSGAGTFVSGIGPFHLPEDLDVAVRRFTISVVDTLPMRATLDHQAAAVTAVQPGGTLHLLIPAAIVTGAPVVTVSAGTPPTLGFTAEAAAAGSATATFLGDGGALLVTFPADQPPEDPGQITITLSVGPPATAVPVHATLDFNPLFTLDPSGAGPATASPGGNIVLVASDSTELAQPPGPLPAGVTGYAFAPAQPDRVTVTFSPALAIGALVPILIADAGDATRMARRTITIV